jgi:hypothetical protein
MYCSACGSAVTAGLSYCNKCGANLSKEATSSRNRQEDVIPGTAQLTPDGLVWAIVSELLGGIGVIIGLMAAMKNVVGFGQGWIAASVLTCLLLLFAVEGVFIWLLLGRAGFLEEQGSPARRRRRRNTGALPKHELDANQPGPIQVPAPPRSLPEHLQGVTERPTQTFDPISVNRESE